MDLIAVILAGGRSSRMGRDKALLELNEQKFIDHLVQELSGCCKVMISAAHQDDYAGYGVPVIADETKGIGPIEGIRQALRSSVSEYVFVCAVDTPFVRKEMIQYLAEFISSDYDAFVFRDGDRIHPHIGIYSRAALPAIEEMIGEKQYRLTKLLSRIRTKYVDIGTSCFDRKVLRNINTPDDYLAILNQDAPADSSATRSMDAPADSSATRSMDAPADPSATRSMDAPADPSSGRCMDAPADSSVGRRPLVFCVSGVKNSGKTHLVERLIHSFTEKGMSVGVIKHDGHSFECDVPGTDSDRFYRAGAMATAVFSASQSFIRLRREAGVEELIRQMENADVVIIEGLKYSSLPKVEVIRKEVSCRSICDSRTLLCIASDTPLSEEMPCPVFDLDDTEGIVKCIMNTCHGSVHSMDIG